MSRTYKVLLAVAILLIVVFFVYGRSLWYPKYVKVKGIETVVSVVDKIGPDVWNRLKEPLAEATFESYPKRLKIQAFKEEQLLEVYGGREGEYHWIKSYPVTKSSGNLGPKLKEGDRQVPEGIYKIEYLNPNSSFYLSAKINYPNEFDKQVAQAEGRYDIGSDIFIHGKASSIGCIPIGDEAMEEVFVLMHHSLHSGIEVVISPRDFRKPDVAIPQVDKSWYPDRCERVKQSLINKT